MAKNPGALIIKNLSSENIFLIETRSDSEGQKKLTVRCYDAKSKPLLAKNIITLPPFNSFGISLKEGEHFEVFWHAKNMQIIKKQIGRDIIVELINPKERAN